MRFFVYFAPMKRFIAFTFALLKASRTDPINALRYE